MLGQARSTQRRARQVRSDEMALRGDVVRLAGRFGRYGYRQVVNLLRIEGWQVNHKRVERIWRQEGLKVRNISRSGAVCGSMTDRVSGFDRCMLNTYGRMTS